MAQKITYLCDLHLKNDGVERERAVAKQITVDGECVAVDLCLECAIKVQEQFAALLKAGELVRQPAGRKRAASAPVISKAERMKIRTWGENNDYKVSERGQLAAKLVKDYYEAARKAEMRMSA